MFSFMIYDWQSITTGLARISVHTTNFWLLKNIVYKAHKFTYKVIRLELCSPPPPPPAPNTHTPQCPSSFPTVRFKVALQLQFFFFVSLWFRKWRLFYHYLFFISPSLVPQEAVLNVCSISWVSSLLFFGSNNNIKKRFLKFRMHCIYLNYCATLIPCHTYQTLFWKISYIRVQGEISMEYK